MSKATLIAALQKVRDILQAKMAQVNTDITNLQSQLTTKQAEKQALKAEIDQFNADVQSVRDLVP